MTEQLYNFLNSSATINIVGIQLSRENHSVKKLTQFRIEPAVAISFLLVWITGVYTHFLCYGEHFYLFRFLLSIINNFVWLSAIVVSAFCLGKKVWRLFKIDFNSCLESFIFSTALGIGILSYSIFLLGVCHLLYKMSCYLLMAGTVLISIPEIRSFIKRLHEEQKSRAVEISTPDSGFIVLVKIIFAVSTLVYLVQVFSPPMNYDSLAYHLAVPKIYIEKHAVVFIPNNVYANFPMTMEFLYALGLLLRGDSLAKLTHFLMGILTALAVYSFSMKHFGRRVAFTASLIFYNIPFVGFLSGCAFNDLMLTTFEFLSLSAIINWFLLKSDSGITGTDTGLLRKKWMVVSAVFCGLSAGTKYPAFLLLFPFVVFTIMIRVLLVDRKNFLVCLKKTGIFLLIVMAVVSPWFLKNIFYTHNPVYPYFYGIFSRLFGDPSGGTFNIQRFMKHHSTTNFSVLDIFPLLWKINMDKLIGPVFILFIPLLLLIRSIKPAIKLILCFGGMYFLLWAFFTHQDVRFLIPCFPALCIASSYAVNGITSKETTNTKILTFFLRVVIIFVVLFNLSWMILTIAKHDLLKVAAGNEDRDEFLMNSPYYQYPAFKFINEELPEDAKVLFVGENQTYFCNREIISNSPFDTNIIVEVVNKCSSEKDIRSRLGSMGITHILYNASEAKRTDENYDSFKWADETAKNLFIDFMSSGEYLRVMFSRKGVIVGELAER